MKRSKSVRLLGPIAVAATVMTGCKETTYPTKEACQANIGIQYKCEERYGGGGFHGYIGTYHTAYTGPAARGRDVPSIRYGFVPGVTRGGFGVTGRAFASAAT